MILPYLDSVGMDLKLPASVEKTGGRNMRNFSSAVTIISGSVYQGDYFSHTIQLRLERSAELVAAVSPEIPVFMQPVTPLNRSNWVKHWG